MKNIIVRKKCPRCPGEMKYNGICYTSYPAQYGHECNQCSNLEILRTSYPNSHVEYELDEIEERYD